MEETTFTKEQLDQAIADAKNEWVKNELNPLQTQLETIKTQLPSEPTEEEKALATKQQELWQKEVALTLQENGLQAFKDIINVKDSEELQTVTQALQTIVNDIKKDAGYIPTDQLKDDAYNVAKQKGDTKNMIKHLFKFN